MSTAPSDLGVGSFSETPPWTLDDPHAPAWRQGLTEVRARVRGEVPQLTQPARLPVVRVVKVARPLGLALSGWGLREYRGGDRSTSRAGLSRRLRIAAEHLGPTYIKLGQIISSGEGIFPAELVDQFKLLRDKGPPESFATVRLVIEEDPGPALVELFAETIVEELDFRLEAENMLDIAWTYADLGQRHYVVPRPHPELVTRRGVGIGGPHGVALGGVAGMRHPGGGTQG